jgi:hypothetical protein
LVVAARSRKAWRATRVAARSGAATVAPKVAIIATTFSCCDMASTRSQEAATAA